jgi:hypothetical protein
MSQKSSFIQSSRFVSQALTPNILALIGALAEHHIVDPAKVAESAEFFAEEMENSAGASPCTRTQLPHSGSGPLPAPSYRQEIG